MWEDIDLVPGPRSGREPRGNGVRPLVLLVLAALVAGVLPLIT